MQWKMQSILSPSTFQRQNMIMHWKMQLILSPSTFQTPDSKLQAKCLCIDSHLDFISIIPICDCTVKRKSFLGEKVLWKHVYGNVQMPYQLIPQLGFYKRQSGQCSFIFHIANDLDNGQLYKFHELKETSN